MNKNVVSLLKKIWFLISATFHGTNIINQIKYVIWGSQCRDLRRTKLLLKLLQPGKGITGVLSALWAVYWGPYYNYLQELFSGLQDVIFFVHKWKPVQTMLPHCDTRQIVFFFLTFACTVGHHHAHEQSGQVQFQEYRKNNL